MVVLHIAFGSDADYGTLQIIARFTDGQVREGDLETIQQRLIGPPEDIVIHSGYDVQGDFWNPGCASSRCGGEFVQVCKKEPKPRWHGVGVNPAKKGGEIGG